jgi:tetratricopeptide (TPR) repeat protein
MMHSVAGRIRVVVRGIVLVAVALGAACGGASRRAAYPPPPADDRAPLVVADATFAALGSEAVRVAALAYPAIAEEEPQAPMSLTASDGTGLRLDSLEASAVIEGPIAFTEIRLGFVNPNDRELEGRFEITLPPTASISRLAMRIDDRWQEAEVVEQQLARRAYEDFLHRKQDPALLERQAGNVFGARIFPIAARGKKELIVSYSEELPRARDTYRLRLAGLSRVRALSANVRLPGGGSASLTRSDELPERDFEVPLQGTEPAALRSGEWFVARVAPLAAAGTDLPSSVCVLVDTSASRAPAFARDVERVVAIVGGLRKSFGDELPLAVSAFDQDVLPVFEGAAASFGSAARDALLARRPLGASNIAGALRWAGTQSGCRRIVLVSDGVATSGATDVHGLVSATRAAARVAERIDAVAVGGIRDEAALAAVVRGGARRHGVVIDGDTEPLEIARRIGAATQSGIAVSVPGASWTWPERLDGVQPGDELLVFARLAAQVAAGPIALSVGGKSHSFSPARAEGPLLERAAARAQIARLEQRREALAPKHPQRERLRHEIVSISTRLRVLSSFTSLLVLETEEDYQRFGIDRRALAGILTVGPRGVELVNRSQLVIAGRRAPVTSGEEADESLPMQDRPEPAPGAEPAKTSAERPTASAPAPAAAAPPPPEISPPSAAPPPEAMAGEEAPASPVRADEPSERVDDATKLFRELKRAPPAHTGRFAKVTALVGARRFDDAVVEALAYRSSDPGDVMALVALGTALEARGADALAARAYGSIVDLHPGRADLRRFAGTRLERLRIAAAHRLALDTFRRAVEQRPDHLTGHRLLAYALVRAGRLRDAFAALERGIDQPYPPDRFAGGRRILGEDLGLVAAAWRAREPAAKAEIDARLARRRVPLPTRPSLRFVLYWETDANDVDFHVLDNRGGHASYRNRQLPSGGELYEDVTNGYGPECFAIDEPRAFPYRLLINYYSRGPMGYGMGKLEIVRFDGKGRLDVQQRPFVVMNDGAWVDLGEITH